MGEGAMRTIATEGDRAGDRETVSRLIGRPVRCGFAVVVRDEMGSPVVIQNEPLLDDGTPMPTRWWLTSRDLCAAVGRVEAGGGVRLASETVDPMELEQAHAQYARERDRALPSGHSGPRPTGGVGGARAGVKCLHAHLAWYLAGGGDPVGLWVAGRIGIGRSGPFRAVAEANCETVGGDFLHGRLQRS